MATDPRANPDPFEVLQLTFEATLDDARAARRRLAFDRHPDRGGSVDAMRELNVAFDAVVAHLTGRRPLTTPQPTPSSPTTPAPERGVRRRGRPTPHRRPPWSGRLQHDAPSFVINALPAEAFEALLVVTSWIGEVLVDDPPYVLETRLWEPSECWCRLDIVPEAGSSSVTLTVARVGADPAPDVDDVRDVWVHQLNQPGAFE